MSSETDHTTPPAASAQPVAAAQTPAWAVQLVVSDIGGFGPLRYAHSYMRVVDPQNKPLLEFHGYNRDEKTGLAISGAGGEGQKLTVAMVQGAWEYFSQRPILATQTLAQGNLNDIEPTVHKLVAASQYINNQNLDYKGWGFFDQGQNCNSVARVLTQTATGQDIDINGLTPLIATGAARQIEMPEWSRLLAGKNSVAGVQDVIKEQSDVSMVTMPKLSDLLKDPDVAQALDSPSQAAAAVQRSAVSATSIFRPAPQSR